MRKKNQRVEEVRSGIHSIPQCKVLRTLSSSAPAGAIHTPCKAPQTNAAVIWQHTLERGVRWPPMQHFRLVRLARLL